MRFLRCGRGAVYQDGTVCISILHPPGDDPIGYESSSERWSPVQSVEKILLSVVSMLAEPNDESGAYLDAAVRWEAVSRNKGRGSRARQMFTRTQRQGKWGMCYSASERKRPPGG